MEIILKMIIKQLKFYIMKKVSLLFAMIFAVTFVMAQNTSTTTQTGDKQEAYVTQVGSSSAVVTQSTDDNYAQKATINQNGAANIANVNQVETGVGTNRSTYASDSKVTQAGDGNSADIDVFETGGGDKGNLKTTLTQTGNGNTGTQYVNAPGSNSGHTVIAVQNGDNNISTQTTNGGYTLSYSTDQNGTSNIATQTGHGDVYTDARIKQEGMRNKGTQDIYGSNNGYQGAVVMIDQLGEDNTAKQTFTGSGSSHQNNGLITQVGDWNTATQTANGRSLDLQIIQTGDLNEATQTVSGNNYGLVPARGLIKITQTGDDNEATQTADGDGIIGTILQVGNFNTASMSQTGNMHTATITQTGNSNIATVTQN
jgi:hypothetical protein